MGAFKNQKWAGLATGAVFAAVTATGCGSGSSGLGSMIDQMKVKLYQQDGDTYAQVTSALNTGGLIIAGLDLPITKHGDASVVLGHIGIVNNFCLTPTNCSDSELQLSVNLSQIAHTS